MCNISESQDNEPSQQLERDLDICEDLIGNELKVEEFEIVQIIRRGKKDQNKVRPILIQLRDNKEKWRILEKAKNMKTEKYKGIFIMKDITNEERERER